MTESTESTGRTFADEESVEPPADEQEVPDEVAEHQVNDGL